MKTNMITSTPHCEVVLAVDPLAALILRNRPIGLQQLSIAPGGEPDCFLVRATAPVAQLPDLAQWARDWEPNVTVLSPSWLRDFVDREGTETTSLSA